MIPATLCGRLRDRLGAASVPDVPRGRACEMRGLPMCRWIAYLGEPIFLEDFVTAPAQSLVVQSRSSREAKNAVNGDGFGLGWYGERQVPGIFRDVRPAWSDENLLSLAQQ